MPKKKLPGRAAEYYLDLETEHSYEVINRQLRAGERISSERGRQVARDMRAAMRETTEDLEVWRGRPEKIDYAVGDEFSDRAFSSWSTGYGTAVNFAGGWAGKAEGTLYRVRIPKGSRAVVENEAEQEVLLRPGSKYRVAEIIDNADKGASKLYRGPSRVYVLEIVKDGAD